MKKKVHEHHHRTLVKSISWFFIGFIIAFTVLITFTGDPAAAARDSLLIQMVKFVFFYVHERVWSKISYGQAVHEDPDTSFE